MSAFGGKADMSQTWQNVRYLPKADIDRPSLAVAQLPKASYFRFFDLDHFLRSNGTFDLGDVERLADFLFQKREVAF